MASTRRNWRSIAMIIHGIQTFQLIVRCVIHFHEGATISLIELYANILRWPWIWVFKCLHIRNLISSLCWWYLVLSFGYFQQPTLTVKSSQKKGNICNRKGTFGLWPRSTHPTHISLYLLWRPIEMRSEHQKWGRSPINRSSNFFRQITRHMVTVCENWLFGILTCFPVRRSEFLSFESNQDKKFEKLMFLDQKMCLTRKSTTFLTIWPKMTKLRLELLQVVSVMVG